MPPHSYPTQRPGESKHALRKRRQAAKDAQLDRIASQVAPFLDTPNGRLPVGMGYTAEGDVAPPTSPPTAPEDVELATGTTFGHYLALIGVVTLIADPEATFADIANRVPFPALGENSRQMLPDGTGSVYDICVREPEASAHTTFHRIPTYHVLCASPVNQHQVLGLVWELLHHTMNILVEWPELVEPGAVNLSEEVMVGLAEPAAALLKDWAESEDFEAELDEEDRFNIYIVAMARYALAQAALTLTAINFQPGVG